MGCMEGIFEHVVLTHGARSQDLTHKGTIGLNTQTDGMDVILAAPLQGSPPMLPRTTA